MTAFLPEMNLHFRLYSDGMYGWSQTNGYMEYGDLNRMQIWTKPSVHHPGPSKSASRLPFTKRAILPVQRRMLLLFNWEESQWRGKLAPALSVTIFPNIVRC
jgi:hypothetical protein